MKLKKLFLLISNCNSSYYTNLGLNAWTLDCSGSGCLPIAWIGNGLCQDNPQLNSGRGIFPQVDGSTPYLSFNCSEYNYDGGDCGEGILNKMKIGAKPGY